ncbi:MAG: fructosamine kinase family protein [Actinomycetota bacterium]
MDVRELQDVVCAATDDHVDSVARVSGGDVAESYRMQLASGRVVFAKTHRDPPPDFFETEASGLTWLREGVVDGADGRPGVAVPDVVTVGPGHLVLEWIDEVPSSRAVDADERERDLGRGLAALHRSGAPFFGRADRRTTGSRRLPNEPVESWPEHFAGNRLVPLAQRWRDTPSLPSPIADRLVGVADRLDELGVPDEPAARLHGDLWAGNRIVGRRAGERTAMNWLIDPAAHGGHREFDLAMMLLFGGFGTACFGAYDLEYPLESGWRTRVPLHQLAPLAVHAIKFGGGYVAATDRALDHVFS